MQLIECVPNFSEGKNLTTINEIARVIATVNGAHLLHKDIGISVNRTVMTIAGEPEAVTKAAFHAIDYASRFIDMRSHLGEHPCIGATDVCPIIPLANITVKECVDLSMQLAKRVGEELKIPVYLYGESALIAERKNLAYLRKGDYDNLALRMEQPDFKPDFGPLEFNARSGATVIGAEPLYIAYNLNLNTPDLKIAKAIAQEIRTRRQNDANSFWHNCEAIGWFVEDYGICQISLNLLDHQRTSLVDVFKAVAELAAKYGSAITGSEIIGLVPISALLLAGKQVMGGDNVDNMSLNEEQLVDAAIKFLNLSQCRSFIPSERVLEYKLADCGLNFR